MHAVTIVDGQLDWREHPDPEPGTGEVLVEVRAAGLNGADRLQVAGHYPVPPGAPADIPGLELAGEVSALGPGCTRFGVGDRVMAVVAGGGQAERAVVHERHLLPVPDDVPWDQAGGFPEVFTTAHDALFTQCGLQMGERVLVTGAAGGGGSAAGQLARAHGGVEGTPAGGQRPRADLAAPGSPGAPLPAVEAVDAGPHDVVLELVGAPNLGDDLATLAEGGRISVIGVGAGAKAELNLLALMGKRARIHGSTLRARSLEDKADAARRVERHVVPLLAAGALSVPVHATYEMSRAADAYGAFAAGGKLGKIVLTR